MSAIDYVTIAAQMLVVGAVFEGIVILIGYIVRFVIRTFTKGGA